MTARFITAPDKISDSEIRKILIVDAEWHDIEAVTFLCMTKNVDVDFYLFGPTSIDTVWLQNAIKEADVILVSEENDRHIELKKKLTDNNDVISIGGHSEYATPLDYIIKTEVQ